MKRILGIAGAMLLPLGLFAPVALAAEPLSQTGRVLISTAGDVNIPAGEQADAVIVIDGTATIAGEVNTIVVIDGAVDLTGARAETVVAIRSPVSLGPDTVVFGDVMRLDSPVQQVGNAQVQGQITDLRAALVGIGAVLGPALLVLWIGFGLAMIVAALLLVALGARQVQAAEAVITGEPVLTLAVGILGLFVTPFVAFLLIATIVGAPLGLGILIELWPLMAFLGYLVAGIWIGDWILRRATPQVPRERPYLAAVIGVFVLLVLGVVPILSILAMIASLFGFGAVILLSWRTFRSRSVPQASIASTAPAPVAT